MTADTKRNFMIGGTFFALLLIFLAYQAFRTKGCEGGSHSVLVLVDFTDAIGDDTRAALKDQVWFIVEKAPDFSKVILRPILGANSSGAQIDHEAIEECRMEKPDFTSPWTGSAKEVRKKWRVFKDQICGKSQTSNDTSCSDPKRDASFFEKTFETSASSPIMEQIVDNTRRFLASPERSWDLIVASDWRQFTNMLDLHTQPCQPGRDIDLSKLPLFTQAGNRLFRASQGGRRPNEIHSLFIPRKGMTNEEVDCLLDRVAAPFFFNNMEGGGGVEAPLVPPLPRS